MIIQILEDALLSAIAAIGFAAISRPPRRVYAYCALIAAAGHSLRFILMNPSLGAMNIIMSTVIAAFLVGLLAVLFSPLSRTPAETCLFPSLLPMIPGIYAYKSFGGLAMCIIGEGREVFDFYFYQFSFNAMMCVFIILGMVFGATVPIFLFKKISFQATR